MVWKTRKLNYLSEQGRSFLTLVWKNKSKMTKKYLWESQILDGFKLVYMRLGFMSSIREIVHMVMVYAWFVRSDTILYKSRSHFSTNTLTKQGLAPTHLVLNLQYIYMCVYTIHLCNRNSKDVSACWILCLTKPSSCLFAAWWLGTMQNLQEE